MNKNSNENDLISSEIILSEIVLYGMSDFAEVYKNLARYRSENYFV